MILKVIQFPTSLKCPEIEFALKAFRQTGAALSTIWLNQKYILFILNYHEYVHMPRCDHRNVWIDIEYADF